MGVIGLLKKSVLGLAIMSADAWNKEGFEAIGMTAMSALNAQSTARVKVLMGGKDVSDIAGWGLKVNEKHPWTKEFQFEMQRDDSCGYTKSSESNCPKGRCLVNAIKHFWTRLTDPTNEVFMKYEPNTKLTDADQVKFLVSLISNLANPIHLGYQGDKAGELIDLDYHKETKTLQYVWDSGLVESLMKDQANSWYSGWTHVNAVKTQYEAEKKEFHEKGALYMFDKWAEEMAKMACEKVYKDPFTAAKLTSGYKVTEIVEMQWKNTIRQQILIGGARVAIVMNALLEHKNADELKGGTYVKEVDEGEKKRARSGHAPLTFDMMLKNFLTNLVIFFVVLALFAFIERKTLLASSYLHRPVHGAADTIGRSS